jgi:hypothetical protein
VLLGPLLHALCTLSSASFTFKSEIPVTITPYSCHLLLN